MKRFTETCKWDDPWFRALTGIQKLIFLYVIDRCNNAGFWERDDDSMAFHTKLKPDLIEGAWKGLGRGLFEASGWVWVRRFLRHQKNESLNAENPAHKQIIALLCEQQDRFESVPEFSSFIAPFLGLLSPIGNGKGKGQGKEEGMQGEKQPRAKGNTETDDEWIAGLQNSEAYRGIAVKAQLSKAQFWCKENKRNCTRKFFLGWLNRSRADERTIATNGATPKPAFDIAIWNEFMDSITESDDTLGTARSFRHKPDKAPEPLKDRFATWKRERKTA